MWHGWTTGNHTSVNPPEVNTWYQNEWFKVYKCILVGASCCQIILSSGWSSRAFPIIAGIASRQQPCTLLSCKGIPLHGANLTRGLSTVKTCSIVPTEVHRSHDTLVQFAHLSLASCATTDSKCSKDFAFDNFGSSASIGICPHTSCPRIWYFFCNKKCSVFG